MWNKCSSVPEGERSNLILIGCSVWSRERPLKLVLTSHEQRVCGGGGGGRNVENISLTHSANGSRDTRWSIILKGVIIVTCISI